MPPVYDYFCETCQIEFDIFKSIKEHRNKEPCPKCGKESPQDLSRCRPQFIGTKIEDAEFNIGLGKITKSKRHREELTKQAGMVEIGNDFKEPDKIHQHFDKNRAEKLKKSWDDV